MQIEYRTGGRISLRPKRVIPKSGVETMSPDTAAMSTFRPLWMVRDRNAYRRASGLR
jgi:hypothetical protein